MRTAQRRSGDLHRRTGYLSGDRKDKAAGHGSLPIKLHVPEVALQQLPKLHDVHPSTPVDALAIAGVGLLVRGGDDERCVLLQDALDLRDQIFRMLQVVDNPEGHHDIEVAFGVR